MYKVANGMSPEIMNEVFKQRNNPQNNLRHTSQFSVNPIHSVYNGTVSASYLGLKSWPNICQILFLYRYCSCIFYLFGQLKINY